MASKNKWLCWLMAVLLFCAVISGGCGGGHSGDPVGSGEGNGQQEQEQNQNQQENQNQENQQEQQQEERGGSSISDWTELSGEWEAVSGTLTVEEMGKKNQYSLITEGYKSFPLSFDVNSSEESSKYTVANNTQYFHFNDSEEYGYGWSEAENEYIVSGDSLVCEINDEEASYSKTITITASDSSHMTIMDDGLYKRWGSGENKHQVLRINFERQ